MAKAEAILVLCFDTIVVLLTVARTFKIVRASRHARQGPSVVQIFLRDGMPVFTLSPVSSNRLILDLDRFGVLPVSYPQAIILCRLTTNSSIEAMVIAVICVDFVSMLFELV